MAESVQIASDSCVYVEAFCVMLELSSTLVNCVHSRLTLCSEHNTRSPCVCCDYSALRHNLAIIIIIFTIISIVIYLSYGVCVVPRGVLSLGPYR